MSSVSYIIADSKLEGKGLFSIKNYNIDSIIATDLDYISLNIVETYQSNELSYLFNARLPGEEIPFAAHILLNYSDLRWIHELSPLNKDVKIAIPYSNELQTIKKYFNKHDKLSKILTNYSDEQLLNYLLKIKNNYIKRLKEDEKETNSYNICFLLFRNFSKLNHNCNPNTTCNIHYNQITKKWNANLIALSKIKAGNELTVSYSGYLQILPSESGRRIYIYNMFGFVCKCAKCCNINEKKTLVYCKHGWNRIMPKRGEEWCNNIQNTICIILETQNMKITCQKLEDYEKGKDSNFITLDYNLWMEILYDPETSKSYPRYYRLGSNNNTGNVNM
jgi:hypothetical protein